MKKICVIGNFSGRNAGDAAILGGVLREISSRYDCIEYLIPTLNPRFIRDSFREYPIKPISLLPWNGSLKLLGLPAWNAMRSSDLILVTDAILFDRGLFNPVHNYLSSLALWIPRAKRRGVHVVLYNVSLGPIKTRAGRWCLKQILDNSDLVILRDEESRKILDLVGPTRPPVKRGADSALSATPCGTERGQEILRDKFGTVRDGGRVGINLNAYGDSFVRNGRPVYSQEKILSVISKAAEWIYDHLKADIWLFGTQYMDVKVLRSLQSKIGRKERPPLFTNREYTYGELTRLFAEIDLLVGMRTHSLILASSVGTPVVGLVTYPKTYGYLERIGQRKYTIPIQELELERLIELVGAGWEARASLRQNILRAVEQERKLAWSAAEHLKPYLSTSHIA
jgi:polysaccharide pyruvyl transferase WcaK-like protein